MEKRKERSEVVKILKLTVAVLTVIVLLFVEVFHRILILFKRTSKEKIHGKLALVTGGANGIGRSIVIELAREGCNIAIADIDIEMAEKTAREVSKKFNVKAQAFKCDVSDFDAVMKLKDEVESSLGFVTLLVNNAGLLCFNLSLRERTPEEIQKVVQVNLMSQLWTVRAFLDGMIERKCGYIVSVCSLAGKVSYPLSCIYTASKFGVTGLMDSLHDFLGLTGYDEFIKTTTIYPSFTGTYRLIKDLVPDEIPVQDSEEVAKELVKGILENQRTIYCPKVSMLSLAFNFVPDRVRKEMFKKQITKEVLEKVKTLENEKIDRETFLNEN